MENEVVQVWKRLENDSQISVRTLLLLRWFLSYILSAVVIYLGRRKHYLVISVLLCRLQLSIIAYIAEIRKMKQFTAFHIFLVISLVFYFKQVYDILHLCRFLFLFFISLSIIFSTNTLPYCHHMSCVFCYILHVISLNAIDMLWCDISCLFLQRRTLSL